jgi:hypothetical protein
MKRALATICALGAALAAGDAMALAQRTFVASYGGDADPCSVALPCRSFGAAIAQTADNGEIIVIDTAGYGTVSITKSVSIIAPFGIYAGIGVGSGVSGVTVNAAGIRVRLKGLTINGISASSRHGVEILQAASVSVEDCAIANLGQYAVMTASATDVTLSNTTMRGNQGGGARLQLGALTVEGSRVIGNANFGISMDAGKTTVARTLVTANAQGGIHVSTSGSAGTLSVGSTSLVGNGTAGIDIGSSAAGGPARVAIAGNMIVANGSYGVYLANGPGGAVVADVGSNQLIGHSSQGLVTAGGSVSARVSANSVFGNNTGLAQSTGVLYTLGDNYVRDNATNVSGSTADSPL